MKIPYTPHALRGNEFPSYFIQVELKVKFTIIDGCLYFINTMPSFEACSMRKNPWKHHERERATDKN